MIGGAGNDMIVGSPGKDTIEGGSGNDTILGLANDDTYVFKNGYGTDKLVDYYGHETLDFSGASSNLTAVDVRRRGVHRRRGRGQSPGGRQPAS